MTNDYISAVLTQPDDIEKPEVLLRFVQISDTHVFDGLLADKTGKYSQLDRLPEGIREAVARLEVGQAVDNPQLRKAVNRVVERINQLPFDPDFVLHTGDVAFDPDRHEEYSAIKEIFSQMSAPVYFLPGNHDTSQFLQEHLSHLDQIKPTFDYVIPDDQVQILCLDSSTGALVNEQLAWLEQQLTGGDSRPLVVALHHNLVSYGEFFGDLVMLRNHKEVRDLLQTAKDRLRGVFYGHMHMILDVVQGGITYYCCPSSWTQFDVYPYVDASKAHDNSTLVGFNLVTLTNTQTLVRRIVFDVD
jgi:Icc protein